MTKRLSEATLGALPAGIARPTYDRRQSVKRIVHLGPGAFHRAHQGVFTEDAQLAGGEAWTTTGVSLRNGEAKAALAPQDGLYAVEFLSEWPRVRVVGGLGSVLTAQDTPGAVLAALAAPTTHVITLTITEAGYRLNGEGALDFDHPDIALDLAGEPRSAVGWIVRGLAERRRVGAGPLTVISCDNLLGNGAKLEAAVLTLADRQDPSLTAWIEGHAAFPSTMVDCIVPASDARHRQRVTAALRLEDRGSVQREVFAQWAIEDSFAGPRPAWERAGAEFVANVAAHERLKLHGLNAVHSALAYLGLLKDLEFMRQAIADPELAAFADALIAKEIAPALPDLPVAPYWRGVRARLANPRLDHRLEQIGEDGSVKLGQRILPLIVAGARAGRPTSRLAAVVRAWLVCARRGLAKDVRSGRLAVWVSAGGSLAAALDDPLLFPEPFRTEAAARAAILETPA
ncbi:MAG TPA: mannitol dehydrogenase family protein [Caulobacteraceae bacterium]